MDAEGLQRELHFTLTANDNSRRPNVTHNTSLVQSSPVAIVEDDEAWEAVVTHKFQHPRRLVCNYTEVLEYGDEFDSLQAAALRCIALANRPVCYPERKSHLVRLQTGFIRRKVA